MNYDFADENQIPEDILNVLLDPDFDLDNEEHYRKLLYYAYGRVMWWPALTRAVAKRIRQRDDMHAPNPDNHLAKALAQGIHQDSFAELEKGLTDEQVGDVLKYLEDKQTLTAQLESSAEWDANKEEKERPPYESYLTKDILNAPHLLEFATNPLLIEAGRAFIGCTPTMCNIQLWWTHPADDYTVQGGYSPVNWHRDLNDYGMYWVYLYLTDADPEHGTHQIIQGTNRGEVVTDVLSNVDFSKYSEFGSFGVETFFDQFGYQIPNPVYEDIFQHRLVSMDRPKGSAFLSTGLGFHRLQPPSEGSRLIFAARYSVNPIMGVGTDDYMNRPSAALLRDRIPDTPEMRYAMRHMVSW